MAPSSRKPLLAPTARRKAIWWRHSASAGMPCGSQAVSTLRRLKALGVRIAMDDFGTGYSSLSYLQSVPIDKIKIDQTFISNLDSNPQSAAIVRAVIGLARGLDLPIIAEGVETSNQLAFLSREACDEVQVISSAARTRSTIMPRSLGDGCRANADAPWPADDRLLSAVCSDSPLFVRHAFSESKNVAWRGTAFDHRRFGSCRSPAKESNMRLFTGFLAA